MKRRDFLKTAGVAGTTSLAQPSLIFADPRQAAAYFQFHPFVADHPEAVFIKRTTVSDKSAFDEKIEAGRHLASELFFASDTHGFDIATKPNLTCMGGSFDTARMSIATDAEFVSGLIVGMKDNLGMDGGQFYMREGNHLGDAYCPNNQVLD